MNREDTHKEIDELWKEFNNLETEEIFHYSRDSLISKIDQLTTNIEEKKKIQRERNLTWLVHMISHEITNFDTKQEKIQEAILQFRLRSGNNLEFYKKRLEKSHTFLLKSHYSLACFILEKGIHMQNVFNFTLERVNYELTHTSKNHFLNSCNLLVMAFNLNNIYNLKQEIKLNDIVLRSINTLKSQPRYLLEPIEILERLGLIKDKKLNDIINLGLSTCNDIGSTHLKEKILNKVIQLCKLESSKYNQTKENTLLKIAEMYENEAKDQASILAISNLEKAKKYYKQLGDNKKIKQINEEIIEYTKTIDYDVTTTKIEMPEIEIKGETGFAKIQFIANYPFVIPQLKDIKNTVEQQKQDFPIQEMFNTTYFKKDKPVYEKSKIPQKVIQQSIFDINFRETSFAISVKKIEKEGRITSQNYMDFIETFGFYDKTSLKIIKIALERHFDEDYISSIHTLIPQIELTLRQILQEKGKMITKPKEEITMILLSKIIDDCVGIFDENVIHYLKMKFGDPEGLNQRNNIVHALEMDIKDFNHTLSFSLIYVIIRLLVLKN